MDVDKVKVEPGHLACAGCGAVLAMKFVSSELDPGTRVVVPAGCWSIILGKYPFSSLRLSSIHTPFAMAAAFATGIRAALRAKGESKQVVVWAGDGATYDIGFGVLSAAAERNEDMIYFCYDNEGYMNTGGQKSSATPPGARTTTTPYGKAGFKKNIALIISDHGVPYVATASIAYPEDLIEKVKKAKKVRGFRFILIHSPCPTGWGMDPKYTVRASRLAVETGLFPLAEFYDGRWRLTHIPKFLPVEDYIKIQSRFRDSDAELLRDQVVRNRGFWGC